MKIEEHLCILCEERHIDEYCPYLVKQKEKAMTEKQRQAIINMRSALGNKNPYDNLPESVQDASKEIKRLKAIITNNLSIGGTINARHSYLFRS